MGCATLANTMRPPSTTSSSSTTTTTKNSSSPTLRPRLLSLLPPPRRTPLRPSPSGVTIGACVRTGLLHNLRGAPCQDRNAVIISPASDVVMMAVYAGHGKHGARLAELAATVMSRIVKRLLTTAHCLEAVMDHAFVEANIAIDDTPFSRCSGVSVTAALLRRGVLVVGTCGDGCVMIGGRGGGGGGGREVRLRRLHDVHGVQNEEECRRVERFGGVVEDGAVKGALRTGMTRSLGGVEMRKMGICQLPLIRTFEISGRDLFVVVASQQLWGKASEAPSVLAEAVGKGKCPVQQAEAAMDVAFGAAGPLLDATVLAARLR